MTLDALKLEFDALRVKLRTAQGTAQRWVSQCLRDPLDRRRSMAAPLAEYCERFASRRDWELFAAERPELINRQILDACAAYIGAAGIEFLGQRVAGFRIEPGDGGNYREGLRWRGLNSRTRALVHCLFSELAEGDSAVVYAPEWLSPMARLLARRLPHFIGSEYFTNEKSRSYHRHVRHEDLAALSFASASIDRIVVGDVFEHLENLDTVLSELHRVLSPGGILYSTFPFALDSDQHVVRARRRDGKIEHLCEPEYHGDPVRPDGVLVFQLPGWQILDDCRAAGFARAEMIFLSSCRLGVLASDLAGIMVLRAEKQGVRCGTL